MVRAMDTRNPELATWGEANATHPASAGPALPFLGRLLDMPRQELGGDQYMPRVGRALRQ
jgi:hypothetical protein